MPTIKQRNQALVVMIRCPRTGKPIELGVRALDRADYDRMRNGALSGRPVKCPECGEVHPWTAQETFLDDPIAEIENIIDLANRSIGAHGVPDTALSNECLDATNAYCARGTDARLAALARVHLIRGDVAQRSVFAELITGGAPVSKHGKIHTEGLSVSLMLSSP